MSGSTPAHRGVFLCLDGPDGGGKTTQVARLVNWIGSTGRDVIACRDPGTTSLGLELRRLLFDRSSTHGMRAEMFLFMAARAQLVDEVIRPALDAGKVVVTDRFFLASLVYQGYAGGLPVDSLRAVALLAADGLVPDLTLVLDLPPALAVERTGAPRDRIEDRSESYRQAVRRGFLAEVARDPDHVRVIDASADTNTVFSAIQTEVLGVLGSSSRS